VGERERGEKTPCEECKQEAKKASALGAFESNRKEDGLEKGDRLKKTQQWRTILLKGRSRAASTFFYLIRKTCNLLQMQSNASRSAEDT
jgi:hypothetical protein